MGKLITIVGNSGVGKTTLVQALHTMGGYFVGLEEGEQTPRPFHDLCLADPRRYALANQLDFLLGRAQQEQALRQQPLPGLIDGGLDVDFWGFTQLLHHRGGLSDAEFTLCQRFYQFARTLAPPPEIILFLSAPPELVAARYRQRNRPQELAQLADLPLLDGFLRAWVAQVQSENTAVVITLPAHTPDYLQPHALQQLHQTLQSM
jgi:deoxyadenosine/deoxycytidine kinase